jgi:hypothetical protein
MRSIYASILVRAKQVYNHKYNPIYFFFLIVY